MGAVTNVKIEAATVEWSAQNTTKITAVADVASSLNSTFFVLNSAKDATLYHVWYDVGGTGVDPAPAGSTAIEVDITANDSAATVASLTIAAVDAVADFNSKVDPDDSTKFLIQNVAVGTTTATVDGSAATGFTFSTELAGSQLKLGLIDGDIEFGLAEDLNDVTAQQEGTNIIERLRTGKNIESVSIALKETDAAKVKSVLEAGGASFTPGGGTEVTGWGNSKDFNSTFSDSRKLIIHPQRLATTDLSADWAFWRAYPNLESFNFSGESEQLLTVGFNFLPDCLIRDDLRLFVYGDHTQNLLRV